MNKLVGAAALFYVGSVLLGIVSFFAFWTAVIHDFLAKQFVMVIAEALLAPIGVLHGFGLWLHLCH